VPLDSNALFVMIIISAFGFIVMVFLPSIIELKKPRDKGPRRIRKSSLQESVARTPKLVPVQRAGSCTSKLESGDLQEILMASGVKSRRVNKNTVRILEGVEFEPGVEITDNIVVNGALKAGARCVFHGSVKAAEKAVIGDCVVIRGNLISLGDIHLGDDVVVAGSVHSEGSAKLGEKVFVGLTLVAGGDVEVYESSEVSGSILTRGTIKVLRCPRVDLPQALDEIG